MENNQKLSPQERGRALKKISVMILIIDFAIGAGIVIFGSRFFQIPQAQCFLIGAALAIGGFVTYAFLRMQAEKLEKYRD